MSYALVLLPVLLAAVVTAGVAFRSDRRGWAALGLASLLVLVLTVVFDSIMIAVDLFRYDESLLLGLRVGVAPVEDLGYALVAPLLVASLWRLLGPWRSSGTADEPRRERADA
ncbi:lycopene cyclase domain-containing protein [Agrococcus beijingensis]|uniref:lycopene cyclase domain-containing protein n=1 Tax=Agrococcus beijingensis TaxID=3068634 RepID=UPI0027421DFA|nr:lycopene cyclase domain-containing protein [Agrococcus sp. REN33]